MITFAPYCDSTIYENLAVGCPYCHQDVFLDFSEGIACERRCVECERWMVFQLENHHAIWVYPALDRETSTV